jgi:hypothetical protein
MSNIYKNAVYVPTTTANTTVYTCNATTRSIIQNIQLTNGSGNHTVSAYVYSNSSATTVLVSTTTLGAGDTCNLCKGPIILQEKDALLISAASTVVAGLVSLLEVNRGTLSS